jgi:hypothetical protein
VLDQQQIAHLQHSCSSACISWADQTRSALQASRETAR